MDTLGPFWLKPQIEPGGFKEESALLELPPSIIGDAITEGKETSHNGVTAGPSYARHERKFGGRVRVAEDL